MFCICCGNFDDSDPEKDKGLYMACCSVCEEWFHQKCVKIKREVLLSEVIHKRWRCHLCYYRLSDRYLFDSYDKYVTYLLSSRLDLSWLGFEKNFFSCFFVSWIYFNNQEFTFPFLNIFFHVLFPIRHSW